MKIYKTLLMGLLLECFSPVNSYAYTFLIDEFSIIKNGHLWFFDTFDDGQPPPSAPNFESGSPAEYYLLGTVGPESGGKLALDSSDTITTINVAGEDVMFQGATLLTNIDDTDPITGLKIDDTFTVAGVFDLVLPNRIYDSYGIRLHDGGGGQNAEQFVQIKVTRTDNDELRILFGAVDRTTETQTSIGGTLIEEGHEQIVLFLAKESVPSNAITASYAYKDSGITGPITSFSSTADMFDGENHVRAQLNAFGKVVFPWPMFLPAITGGEK